MAGCGLALEKETKAHRNRGLCRTSLMPQILSLQKRSALIGVWVALVQGT